LDCEIEQFKHQITRFTNYPMQASAVLFSGGLDSGVLLADEATRHDVYPVYVSAGLAWERAERAVVSRFLSHALLAGRVRPLTAIALDMRDIYAASHWAIQGKPPAYHTPDEDVYLPGRNIVLIGKAAVYCAAARIGRLVIGTLAHNPFPDATPEFRAAMTRALSLGLAQSIEIQAPFAEVAKADVIRRGAALGVPFELTLSCMNPTGAWAKDGNSVMPEHCGVCSKCRERHDAFVVAGMSDPTPYSDNRYIA
jgi:7-cyano-7-deazaguanine synthase